MKKIFTYVAVCLLFVSCNDYLDIEPKDKVIPGTVQDYDYLVASFTDLYLENELFLSADDFITDLSNLGDINRPNNTMFLMYSFSDGRFSNPDIGTETWNTPYKNIYVYNKVINEIDKASVIVGYKASDIKIIKAEAKYGRAMRYLLLTNMFSKHYNKSTASSDPSVPLVTMADTTQDPPMPSNVEEAYSFIIKDLEEAIPNLPEKRKELNRASKGSGYALLARAYLYKGDYDNALKNAKLALDKKGTLSNYTVATDIKQAYKDEQYTELTMGYVRGFTDGFLSPEAVALFDNTNDIRVTKIAACSWYYDPNTGWNQDCSKIANGYVINPNLDCSVAEMYLTVAECYARKNQLQKALDNANKVRKNRIVGNTDKAVADFSNDKEVLKFVLNERRREMFMNGTRLFDLKRLNLETDFAKTTIHPLEATNYSAEPNSGKLVFPIPAQIKKLNPNL